jgi:hypothetical protein
LLVRVRAARAVRVRVRVRVRAARAVRVRVRVRVQGQVQGQAAPDKGVENIVHEINTEIHEHEGTKIDLMPSSVTYKNTPKGCAYNWKQPVLLR